MTAEEWEKSICPFEDLAMLRGLTLAQVVDSIVAAAMSESICEDLARARVRHVAICLLLLTGSDVVAASLLERSARRVLTLCVNTPKPTIDGIITDIQNLS